MVALLYGKKNPAKSLIDSAATVVAGAEWYGIGHKINQIFLVL